jgi:tRNA dimethylallyltransferase
MQKVIVIEGQTGTGKTQLAYDIAKQYNGEIISADSRQIYRGADIGTNKQRFPDIPTHLIDIRDINETYDAYQFRVDTTPHIADILARGKLPIIVGGTSFYIDVLTNHIQLFETDDAFKAYLHSRRGELAAEDTLSLAQMVKQLDPKYFEGLNNSEKHNNHRLIRFIAFKEWFKDTKPTQKQNQLPYDFIEIGIRIDQNKLQEILKDRVSHMMQSGLAAEVQRIMQTYGTDTPIAQSIGYAEFLKDNKFDTTKSLTTIQKEIVTHTWQYAKRQLTWLKRKGSIHWITRDDIDIDTVKVIQEIIKKIDSP